MEDPVEIPQRDRSTRISGTLQRILISYDREFQDWIEELKFHENLKTEVELLFLEGKSMREEIARLTGAFDSSHATLLEALQESITTRWHPHFETLRRLVAQLMSERQYRSRPCWIQLRDKATFMIMLLEELERNISHSQAETPTIKIAVKKDLCVLLSEEIFSPCEVDQYDADHLKLHHFMVQDEAHEDTLLVNQIKEMLKNLVGGEKKRPYRNANQPGFVNLQSFCKIHETLTPIQKIFEEGVERYGQNGLPTIYYPHVDQSGHRSQNRIIFSKLLRNLGTVQKLITQIHHDVNRKQALSVFFEPTCFYIREVRLASETLMHEVGEKDDSPLLVAMRKLIPMAIRDLKDLSARIAIAEGE